MDCFKFKKSFVFATLASVFALGQSAFAIDAAGLTDIIRNANILKYDKSPKVTIGGAQITTSVDPMGPSGKTSDQDLKIDALLVAKALYDAAPPDLTSCKIIFSNGGKDAKYTIISRQKVSEYSSGSVNAQELLSSLSLTAVVQENQPELVEGPFYERRILVWERIENLRKQGTGVKPFEHLYSELEVSIKANDDQKTIFNKLTSLEEKLSGQETQMAQAKKVAQGKGIYGNFKGSTPPSQNQTQSQSQNKVTNYNDLPSDIQSLIQSIEGRMKIAQQILRSRGDQEGLSESGVLCEDMHSLAKSRSFPAFYRRVQDFNRFLQNKRIDSANVANSGR